MSLKLSDCCFKAFYHEGKAEGIYKVIGGLDSYITGERFGNQRIIVIMTDIFGYKLNNVLLIADQLANSAKIQVVIPDILDGDWVVDKESYDRTTWFGSHGPEITGPRIRTYLTNLRSEKSPKDLFGIGFCFGAKFVVEHLADGGLLTAGAVAHPSLLTPEDIEKITKPILISTGDRDSSFHADLRQETLKILSEKKDLRYQFDLFQGANHGYAVRGDISIPLVKYAKEKTLVDQVYWFSQF